MNNARKVAVVMAWLIAGLVSGCGGGPQHIQTPDLSSRDQIVLLPDAEGGTVGRATVSNPAGIVDLAAARHSTLVSVNGPPAPVTQISEADVSRLFGDVLAALPLPPQHFTLYFRFQSDELTPESRALIARILQAVKDRPVPDVAVVGHTDTMGPPATNVELGLRRANLVRTLLVSAGLDPSSIEVTSHGEAEPLVPTPDETSEPRNRRVEISVR